VRLIVVVGVRANVVKTAPLFAALSADGIQVEIAFAGGRDEALDAGEGCVRVFGVAMPRPTWYLETSAAGGPTIGVSMRSFEQLFVGERPDAVLVCGDVNSTVGAAVSAAKARIPVVHLEAGLRCGDLRATDEINRVLISQVAAMHLTPTEQAMENLEDEGIDPERIHFVGNTVAEQALRELDDGSSDSAHSGDLDVPSEYVLAALHRPDHLGDRHWLSNVVAGLDVSPLPVVLPDSEAIASAISDAGLAVPPRVVLRGPVPHLQMLSLIRGARAIVTDSGGVQEEACVLCSPCITVKSCTEHSATLSNGANALVEPLTIEIAMALTEALERRRNWAQPARWDRAVSDRVVRALHRGVIGLR